MNQDPLDLLRTSIDDSTIPGVSDRVWARAKARQPRLAWRPRFEITAAAAVIAIAAFATTLAPPETRPSVDTTSHPTENASTPVQNGNEHNFATSGYTVSVSLTAANAHSTVPVIGHSRFDLQMTLALLQLREHQRKAFLGYAGWQDKYGIQTCVSLREGFVILLPRTDDRGEAISCSQFYLFVWD